MRDIVNAGLMSGRNLRIARGETSFLSTKNITSNQVQRHEILKEKTSSTIQDLEITGGFGNLGSGPSALVVWSENRPWRHVVT